MSPRRARMRNAPVQPAISRGGDLRKGVQLANCPTRTYSGGIARIAAVATMMLLAACATTSTPNAARDLRISAVTASGDVLRDDWVAVPARSGGREVLTRKEYLAQRARRARPKAPNREQIPPLLLTATPEITLEQGQVRSFMLVDEPVRSMHVSGSSAGVFWTTPYYIDRLEKGRLVEHKGADVHVEGLTPGRTELILVLMDGHTQRYQFDVKESVGSRTRT